MVALASRRQQGCGHGVEVGSLPGYVWLRGSIGRCCRCGWRGLERGGRGGGRFGEGGDGGAMARGGAAIAIGAARTGRFVFGGGRRHCQIASSLNMRRAFCASRMSRVLLWGKAKGGAHQLHNRPVTCRPTADDEHGRRLYPPPHSWDQKQVKRVKQRKQDSICTLQYTATPVRT